MLLANKKMASHFVPCLYKNPAHYIKTFDELCSASEKARVYREWVDSDLFSEAVLGRLQARPDGQEGLRVLGVGSGSGDTDWAILKRLSRQFPRIENRVVEPSSELLGRYKALVKSEAHQLHGVTCDWREQTIEQYQKAGDSTKFHFIVAIDSLYHAEDAVDNWMTYLYSRLENGGIMLGVLKSEDSGFTRFLNDFGRFHEDYNDLSSGEVLSWLNRQGIAYTQHRRRMSMNITACFDRASEEGNLLLDFLTFTAYFREAVTEDLQSWVMERLASGDYSEKNGDQIWLNLDWDALVITKPMDE